MIIKAHAFYKCLFLRFIRILHPYSFCRHRSHDSSPKFNLICDLIIEGILYHDKNLSYSTDEPKKRLTLTVWRVPVAPYLFCMESFVFVEQQIMDIYKSFEKGILA